MAFAGVLLAIGLTCSETRAADPIDTDGPDFVESSEAVGKGRFQYEADGVLERDRRASERQTSTPLLLRYGITDTIELRLETEGTIRAADDGANTGTRSSQTGTGDTALGVKWHSQDREALSGKPAVSWIVHFDIPSGTHAFRGHGIRPSLRSVVTWDLPHDLSLGLMPGLKYDTAENGRRFVSGILGAVLNKRITESARAFIEFSSPQLARGENGGTLLFLDIGAAYLLTHDCQLGVRTGMAANRNTPGGFLLFELAQRF